MKFYDWSAEEDAMLSEASRPWTHLRQSLLLHCPAAFNTETVSRSQAKQVHAVIC